MVFVSELQRKTLMLIDDLIEQGKTFEEIEDFLQNNGYSLAIPIKNGYTSKTIRKVYKKMWDADAYVMKKDYTFVDLRKRRNGLAYWETIRLS